MYIDIPVNWQVTLSDYGEDFAVVSPDKACRINISLGNRCTVDFEEAMKPFSSRPSDESGVESVWEQPFESPPWTGWKYVGGTYGTGRRTPTPSVYFAQYLVLRVIDESGGQYVKLIVNWDYESHMLAQEVGFEEVVDERFSFLEHMLMSIEFLD